ncbi:MAG TPA: SBBP repeat-containing protein [Bacteroidia bacterium]|nr:SBBP repeat-containing protein [Bacteroidia bacterium]
MEKIILSTAIFCFVISQALYAQSPAFEWAKNMGGYYGFATGSEVALDISNNVYTTGYFEGRVDFDPGAGTAYLTSAGNYDIYITKSDASGNFLWVKQLGGTFSDQSSSMVVDGAGNLYVTGSFNGTADFDPGVLTYNLTSIGSEDIFICKLDPSGNFTWAQKFGSTWDDDASSVVIDGAGNVYTTGSFMGNVDFDPGAGSYFLNTGGNFSNVFISKLNSLGNFVWARRMGGSIAVGRSIAIDASWNIYTTGYFANTIDFDPGAGTFNLTSAGGSQDIFISKLNSLGNFVWAKQLGGTLCDYGNSIKTDGSGNVYTIGTFWGTGDFDPGPAVFNMTSLGDQEVFISKLDASGNFLWATQLGGVSSEYGSSITADMAGNVYTTGNFSGTVDFDPGAGTFNLTASTDVFVYKLNSSGNFAWAKQLGGTLSDYGSSIAVDGSGNVHVAGSFNGTADFDPGAGSFILIALGGSFGFTSKLDATGSFVWAKSAGAGAAVYGKSVAADLAGNVYTTGYFYGTVDFDPGAGTFNLSTAATDLSGDVFVSKSDASGNFIWAKQLGGIAQDYANSIAVDASGNVYTAGSFKETADFDPGAGIFNLTASSANFDIFVSKLNASGNFVWATKLGTTTSEDVYSIAVDASGNVFTAGRYFPGTNAFQIYINKVDASGNLLWSKIYGGLSTDIASDIETDASGNIYFTGYFGGTMDFDPGAGTYNLTSAGNSDIFVSRFDGAGNFIWAKQIGGTLNETSSSVEVDASGNIHVTGSFSGTADFDPGAATYNLTAAGGYDIFVSKLNNSGNFVWAKQLGGTDGEFVRSVASDAGGNVYATGDFYGTADFDPGAGTFNLTSAGSYDIFISKLDASGNFVWAQKLGGTSSEQGSSSALDGSGNIYTSGIFYQTLDFDPGTGTSYLTAHGSFDLFIHKMSQCTLPSATITPGGTTTFCSGGSVVLSASAGANKAYQWKKGTNLISGATLSSYTATKGGNYRVIVTNTVTGCSKTTGSATMVTVNALPAATITPQGPTTFCAGGSVVLSANTGAGLTYKWKKGSNFISGVTLSNYTATIGGNYRVQVTNNNGCSKVSALVAVSVPCKEGEVLMTETDLDVSIYPNPSSADFVLEIENENNETISIKVFNATGKLILNETTSGSQFIISNSQLSMGIYAAIVSAGENKKVFRLIKINQN